MADVPRSPQTLGADLTEVRVSELPGRVDVEIELPVLAQHLERPAMPVMFAEIFELDLDLLEVQRDKRDGVAI